MSTFEVNSLKVSTILEYFRDNTVAIPNIQRPFVWDSTKVRDFIDSLYKGYPVGYIITWKSPGVKLKNGQTSDGKQIIIDGQQRITALATALLGAEVIDSRYRRHRIKIAFNPITETFETSNPTIEKKPEWISDISTIMDDENINLYEYVGNYAKNLGVDANKISQNIAKLKAIKDVAIGRIELGASLDIDVVTEIFIRINSKGVQLSQADFAMSKISVNDANKGNIISKLIDYFCHIIETPHDYNDIVQNDPEFAKSKYFNQISWTSDYNHKLYIPKYTDILRVAFTYKFHRGRLQDLVSLLSGRDFETREYREDIVEKSYEDLLDGVLKFTSKTNFQRYAMILKSAGVVEQKLIGSANVKNFGYILYLLLVENNIKPDLIEHCVRRWIIMSILTQRYTSSPESAFDYDIRTLSGSSDIISSINTIIRDELNDSFWTTTLVNNLNTPVVSSPYWKTFIMAQVKLGYKGFLSRDIHIRSLVEQRSDIHHIFPKNYLIKQGYSKPSDYNQIANLAMVQQEINIKISDKAPTEYMSIVLNQCNDQQATTKLGGIDNYDDLKKNLAENCIPETLSTMTADDYNDFLEQRRIMMAKLIRHYFESL